MGTHFPALQHLALTHSVVAEVAVLYYDTNARQIKKRSERVALIDAQVKSTLDIRAQQRSKARERRRSSRCYDGSDGEEEEEGSDDGGEVDEEEEDGDKSDIEKEGDKEEGGASAPGPNVSGPGEIMRSQSSVPEAVAGPGKLSLVPPSPMTSVVGWAALLRLPRGLHRLELGNAALAYDSYSLLVLHVDDLVCCAVLSPAAEVVAKAAQIARREKRDAAMAASAAAAGPGSASSDWGAYNAGAEAMCEGDILSDSE